MEPTSRKGTIRRCGKIWTSSNSGYDNDWCTQVDDRFHAITWKFGSIHQAKVFVDYDHKMDGKNPNSPKVGGSVDICLYYGKTVEEAMQRGLDWIADFKAKGPPSPQKLFEECWTNYPTLYPKGNRISVIDHIFFTIGGGYSWIDGCIMCTTPVHPLEQAAKAAERAKDEERTAKYKELMKEINALKIAKGEEPDQDWDEEREEFWKQDVYRFYPASENYSNVCLVPDDVKPEWLELAYEAALLLKNNSGLPKMKSTWYNNTADDEVRQANNRELGAKVVAELEKRFPHVKKDQQISTQEA